MNWKNVLRLIPYYEVILTVDFFFSQMLSALLGTAMCQESKPMPEETSAVKPMGLTQTLVAGRTIAAASAAAPSSGDSCEFGSSKYFALCGLGGILSCGITHTMVVPLDLVKCRMQVDPVKYKNLIHGFKVTLAEEGTRGLAKGWAPTFFGYSIQVIWRRVIVINLNLILIIFYYDLEV